MEVEDPSVYSNKTQTVSFDQFEACLLCGSARLTTLRGYEQHYLVQCAVCDFIFCKRKPTMDELNTHYALYPRARGISDITLKRYNELLDKFEPYRKTNNLLDVGCGDGFFLIEARKRNWKVFGTEFTHKAIDVCLQKGIQMTKSPLNPQHYHPESFDVITSFEVIEHINTPQTELQSFYSLLRKGGALYITTPNFNSLSRIILKAKWNVIEYPEHLSYYTVQTLCALGRKCRFKRLTASTTGISINRFRSIISNPQSSEMDDPDEEIRQKAERRIIFRLLKSVINAVLNVTSKGDAMKVLFKRL